MGYKKQGAKKGSLLFKKRRGRLLIAFLDNNGPIFVPYFFATHIFNVFLKFQILKQYQANLII